MRRSPTSRRRTRPSWRWLLAVSAVAAAGWAQVVVAQVGSSAAARLATLELGFGGAVVADAWNPLRLVLRDVGPVHLEIVIDGGSLREGEIPSVYRSSVRGGSGLSVFDDEIYVPGWRSLTWTVRSGATTVASGSVPRADVDRRAVDLVVTDAPGPWASRLGEGARVVDVRADRLVTRSAAYDGVRAVIVTGDGDLPRADALVAAAIAGSTVIVSDAAASMPAMERLLPPATSPWRRVGSGWIALAAALERPEALVEARTDHTALVSAFAAAGSLATPASVPTVAILVGATAYAIAVLVILRFGGLPGLVAAVALAAAASFVAWSSLRPEAPVLLVARDLVVGGEGVGLRWRVHDIVSLPASAVALDVAARPLVPMPIANGPDGAVIDLARWQALRVVERPRATSAPLRWDDEGRLVNDGERTIEQVQVKGGPWFGVIAPGGVAAAPSRDPVPSSATALALLDVLPAGSAIASDGTRWFVALARSPAAGDGREGGAP
jgi:hypothetical protein